MNLTHYGLGQKKEEEKQKEEEWAREEKKRRFALGEATEMHQLKSEMGTSLVVRQLRIHLPREGTQV